MGNYDLHGHTKIDKPKLPYRLTDKIKLSPEEVVVFAKNELGLDGIAITDHDSVANVDRALKAGKKHGLIVVPGVEITSRLGGHLPHILALGVTPEAIFTSKDNKIPRFRDPEIVIKWIHDHGGVAVAAHPQQEKSNPILRRISFTHDQIRKYADLLDGVEVISSYIPPWGKSRSPNQDLIDISNEYGLAQLASTDFHKLKGWMGPIRTEVLKPCKNWRDVVEAIRERQTKPMVRLKDLDEAPTPTWRDSSTWLRLRGRQGRFRFFTSGVK